MHNNETKVHLKLTSGEVIDNLVSTTEIINKINTKNICIELEFNKYFKEKCLDQNNFLKKIRYLTRMGYIHKYSKGKTTLNV